MNQRIKRARKGKGAQDLGASTMQTGGHVVAHSRDAEPVVRVPQKTTGDVPAEQSQGLAKASPFFKKLSEVLPKSKADEKKALAEATEDPLEVAEESSKDEETDAD